VKIIVARIRYVMAYATSALALLVFGVGFLVQNRMAPGPGVFSKWARGWARACMTMAGIRVDVSGVEHVPVGHPCVFVSNHQSALDITVVLVAIPTKFGFVAKSALARQPLVGSVLRASPSVFVDGTRPRETITSIRTAAEQIHSGNSVLVFPEGERTWGTELSDFKKRAFVLAARANVPVVPITLYNAHELLDERRKRVHSGTVRVRIDAPIRFRDSSKMAIDDVINQVTRVIRRNLKG
jgi:1-acyl-sn-glycerol-3-phosphate acyltransferase